MLRTLALLVTHTDAITHDTAEQLVTEFLRASDSRCQVCVLHIAQERDVSLAGRSPDWHAQQSVRQSLTHTIAAGEEHSRQLLARALGTWIILTTGEESLEWLALRNDIEANHDDQATLLELVGELQARNPDSRLRITPVRRALTEPDGNLQQLGELLASQNRDLLSDAAACRLLGEVAVGLTGLPEAVVRLKSETQDCEGAARMLAARALGIALVAKINHNGIATLAARARFSTNEELREMWLRAIGELLTARKRFDADGEIPVSLWQLTGRIRVTTGMRRHNLARTCGNQYLLDDAGKMIQRLSRGVRRGEHAERWKAAETLGDYLISVSGQLSDSHQSIARFIAPDSTDSDTAHLCAVGEATTAITLRSNSDVPSWLERPDDAENTDLQLMLMSAVQDVSGRTRWHLLRALGELWAEIFADQSELGGSRYSQLAHEVRVASNSERDLAARTLARIGIALSKSPTHDSMITELIAETERCSRFERSVAQRALGEAIVAESSSKLDLLIPEALVDRARESTGQPRRQLMQTLGFVTATFSEAGVTSLDAAMSEYKTITGGKRRRLARAIGETVAEGIDGQEGDIFNSAASPAAFEADRIPISIVQEVQNSTGQQRAAAARRLGWIVADGLEETTATIVSALHEAESSKRREELCTHLNELAACQPMTSETLFHAMDQGEAPGRVEIGPLLDGSTEARRAVLAAIATVLQNEVPRSAYPTVQRDIRTRLSEFDASATPDERLNAVAILTRLRS